MERDDLDYWDIQNYSLYKGMRTECFQKLSKHNEALLPFSPDEDMGGKKKVVRSGFYLTTA